MQDVDDIEVREAIKSVHGGRTAWILFGASVLIGAGAIAFQRTQLKSATEELAASDARLTQKQAELAVAHIARTQLEDRARALEAAHAEIAPIKERAAAEARALEESEATHRALHEALGTKLAADVESGEVVLSTSPDALTLVIAEALMFDAEATTLSKRGEQTLASIAAIIAGAKGREVEIIGHTDDSKVPDKLRAQLPTAWELTAHRAATAARYLAEKTKVSAKTIAAAGRGAVAPLDPSNTAEARAKNRRIEIVVRRGPSS